MQTLAILKPDVVKAGKHMLILKNIIENCYVINELKTVTLTLAQAKQFYEVHKDKSFFDELTQFMSSGPCVFLVLESKSTNVVQNWRELMIYIRSMYGTDVMHNAVHGSDSEENAKIEISFFKALTMNNLFSVEK